MLRAPQSHRRCALMVCSTRCDVSDKLKTLQDDLEWNGIWLKCPTTANQVDQNLKPNPSHLRMAFLLETRRSDEHAINGNVPSRRVRQPLHPQPPQ
jgi:hypothetical protein